MTRLVMGNIGSTNLSIVVMKKTADLGDNRIKYPVAYETIFKKTYVDNVLIDAPDYNKLKKDIKEIKLVSAMGGFSTFQSSLLASNYQTKLVFMRNGH